MTDIKKLVMETRMKDYGCPVKNWTLIAELWSAYKGIKITTKDALIMMEIMKLVRESRNHKKDNIDDIKGYADIIAMLEKRR